jgi:hypothetical protein
MVMTNVNHPYGEARLMSQSETRGLGLAFVASAVLMIYLLLALWPERVVEGTKGSWDKDAAVFWIHFSLRFELRLFLLVIVASALGSFVHAATSFASYIGNRRLMTSWLWWYLLRMPIGVVLALLFYVVLRGGLMTVGEASDALSPFGVAAVSGLVGMFSKQASDKLRELFDNLFRTAPGRGDAEREDKLEPRAPVLTSVDPKTIPSGNPNSVAVILRGENFDHTSIVQVNGATRATSYRSSQELVGTLTSSDIHAPGSLKITVVTAGIGSSDSFDVTVT